VAPFRIQEWTSLKRPGDFRGIPILSGYLDKVGCDLSDSGVWGFERQVLNLTNLEMRRGTHDAQEVGSDVAVQVGENQKL